MYLRKQKWLQEIGFGVFSFLLAWVFFYLVTHKRPPLTISFAVGLILLAVVSHLILQRGKAAIYLILVLTPFYPFIRIQILRFQIVGQVVMFVVSRWPEALLVISLFGRKLGGIRRLFYSAPILDVLILWYLLLGLAYLGQSVAGGQWYLGMWGAKEQFLFFFYYFAVRWVPFGKEDFKKFLMLSAAIGAVIAAFGCFQAQFFGEDFLKTLGYGIDIRGTGVTVIDPNYSRRLPGGLSFVRAISILQDALSLGAYLMVLVLILHPFYFMPVEKQGRGWKQFQYLVILLGLFYTTTRSAWLGTAAGILYLAWRRKRFVATMGVFLLLGVAFLGLLSTLPGGLGFLELSLSPSKESSARAHLSTYGWQFQIIVDNPMGLGLGMTGRVAHRFGAALYGGFHTECWYLQVGTQMGFLGFFLYIAIVLEIIRKMFILGGKLKDPFLRDAANGILAAYLGCAVFGVFLNVWQCHVIPILMHLFVGIALFHFPAWDEEQEEPAGG